MCDTVFEKTKGRGRTVNRVSVYAEAAVRKNKCYKKFRRIHKIHSLPESLFDKIKSVDLQLD